MRTQRVNDAIGRLTTYLEYNPDATRITTRTYNQDNDLMQVDSGGKGTLYTYVGSDNLLHNELMRSETYGDPAVITSYYSYDYWDSAKQSTIKSQPTASSLDWAPGYSHFIYDVNGHLSGALDEANATNKRAFRYVTDAEGRVLVRSEVVNTAGGDPMVSGNVLRFRNYYYANGRGVGDVGNDPKDATALSRFDYAQSLALTKSNQPEDFTPVNSADFDQNYQPVNDSYPSPTGDIYTVNSGDTLQSIARAVWGDSSLWYLLADANGITSTGTLPANMRLVIPNKVTNIHNTSQTFKPYRPGEVMGDTSPTLPAPPMAGQQKEPCGGAAMLIMIVVLVVATIFTAGAAAGLMSAVGTAGTAGAGALAGTMASGMAALSGGLGLAGMGAAMVGAAVGSLVSQGLGIAMGVQDKFSWKQVAISALGAGATAGMGTLAGAGGIAGQLGVNAAQSPILAGAINGMANNVVGQGVGLVTGQQKKFDWKGVAAGAISGAAGGMLGKDASLGTKLFVNGAAQGLTRTLYGQNFGKGFAVGAVGSLAESATTLVGDQFTGSDKGGFAHGMSHFLMQGTSEAALAYLNGARGGDAARAFVAGGAAGFAGTVLGDNIRSWAGDNDETQQYLTGQIGRAIGAGLGNEGAGQSGATREVTYNYLHHKESLELIAARKREDWDKVRELEGIDRARNTALAAATGKKDAKYYELMGDAEVAARSYLGPNGEDPTDGTLADGQRAASMAVVYGAIANGMALRQGDQSVAKEQYQAVLGDMRSAAKYAITDEEGRHLLSAFQYTHGVGANNGLETPGEFVNSREALALGISVGFGGGGGVSISKALSSGAVLPRTSSSFVRVGAKGAGTAAEHIGILRDAATRKGNFGLGQATAAEAEVLGQSWVGPGHRVASDGKTLVSSDGLRTYRPPSEKSSPFATTGVQANFERLETVKGRPAVMSNGHLDISP